MEEEMVGLGEARETTHWGKEDVRQNYCIERGYASETCMYIYVEQLNRIERRSLLKSGMH